MSDFKIRFAEIASGSVHTQIPLAKILGFHPEVENSLVDGYPTRVDDPRKLDPVVVGWVLKTTPLVVVESTGRKKRGPRMGHFWASRGPLEFRPKIDDLCTAGQYRCAESIQMHLVSQLGHQKPATTAVGCDANTCNSLFCNCFWRARHDSNVRPLPSEGSTLSS